MPDITAKQITEAVNSLYAGKIIAYPTEAVWGLGCDPYNKNAIKRLISLKERDSTKGLILVASRLEHCREMLTELSDEHLRKLEDSTAKSVSTDRATTWLIPANNNVPIGVRGGHKSFALRISKHPTIVALCEAFKLPIISTSANPSGERPASTLNEARAFFGDAISNYIVGELGLQKAPSEIRDLITNEVVR